MLGQYENEIKLQNWLELSWIEEPTQGKSHALNKAIPLIESEIIAFVDDDHRVEEKYLVSIIEAANTYPDATVFCGRIIPDWDGHEPAWVHDKGPYRIYPLPVPRFDQGDVPHEIKLGGAVPGGGNLFLRREVFNRVGGFSTTLGPSGHDLRGGEDSDFVLRALRAGERLQYVPDVVQYHYVDLARLRLPYLIKKSYQRSRVTSRISANPPGRVPAYMWRKLGSNVLNGLVSIQYTKLRFYLVRIAATLGEIRGLRESRKFANQDGAPEITQ
jgi:GT2 family glycosyltransferase